MVLQESLAPELPVLPTAGEEFGFTVARVFVVAVVAVGVDRALALPQAQAWALLGAVTVWALVPVARPATAAVAAVVAWLIGTGFLSNRLGELTFGPHDRESLALMLLAAGVALLVSRRAAAVARARSGARRG